MMSTFVLALNLILKRFRVYVVIILQITITILLFLFIIGRIQFVYKTMELTHTFTGQNAYYFMPYKYVHLSLSDILSKFDNNAYHVGEIGNLALKDDNGTVISAYGYNDTIINSCKLKLKSGSWFTNSPQDGNRINAIAIGRKYSVGDLLSLKSSDGKDYTIKIIGTLDNDSYLLTFNESASKGGSSAEYFVSKPTYDLIVPYDSMSIKSINKTTNSNYSEFEKSLASIIIFSPELNGKNVENALNMYGHTTNISDMMSNYTTTLTRDILIYSIVCIVFTILTIVGLGGNNGIQNILNEHQYIIFYFLGATQKKCVWIEAIRGLLLIAFGFLIALSIYYIFPSIYPASSFYITPATFGVIIIYLSIIYFITSGSFLFRLSKKNLIAAYKQRA